MSTISMAEFEKRLAEMSPKGFLRVMRNVAERVGLKAEARAKLNATGGAGPRVRTGRLRASIRYAVRPGASHIDVALSAGSGRAGKPVKYARLQERGGTINAKPGRYLRIPLPPAKTGAGVDRYGGPLREIARGKFTVIKSRAGNLLLIDIASGTPWYLLRKSVTIPARPYLRPAIDTVVKRDLPSIFSSAIRAEMKVD
jgi:hypothetical protein